MAGVLDVKGVAGILNFRRDSIREAIVVIATRVSPLGEIVRTVFRSHHPIRVVIHEGFEGDNRHVGILEAEDTRPTPRRIE